MDKEIKEQRLPFARAVFILGFLSVTIGIALCGLLGIIGVILARKGMKTFEENPELYSIKDYKTLTRGFYMSFVGSTYVLILLILPFLIL